MFKPKHIAVMVHPQVANAETEAGRVADYIRLRQVQVEHGSLYSTELRARVSAGEFDVLIAMGGDGTMLRAGHLCAPAGTPILGINMGRFGFLTEINLSDWQQVLPRLLESDFWVEKRMVLHSEHFRQDELLNTWNVVVNEVVVSRGKFVRPVHLSTCVDGRYLTTYVADGLIVSTPTGSTAYGLAVGGPILPPELRNILLVPVAPHLSIDRGIVLAEGSSVSIAVQTDHQAVVSIDGQAPIDLENGDIISARASAHVLQFIRFQDPGYFYRNLTPHMSQNPATNNPK